MLNSLTLIIKGKDQSVKFSHIINCLKITHKYFNLILKNICKNKINKISKNKYNKINLSLISILIILNKVT